MTALSGNNGQDSLIRAKNKLDKTSFLFYFLLLQEEMGARIQYAVLYFVFLLLAYILK